MLGERRQRSFWRAVLAQQAHVKVTEVAGTLGLTVPGGCWPSFRKIEQRVPVNARSLAAEQLRAASHTELLNFFCPEARDAHFRNPHRKVGCLSNFVQFCGPLLDLPMVPVERETVHGH